MRFPEIPDSFPKYLEKVLNIQKMSGFISYITLKTQQNNLSSKMATRISAISENYVLVQHTTRL